MKQIAAMLSHTVLTTLSATGRRARWLSIEFSIRQRDLTYHIGAGNLPGRRV
jgi:hypothetical protein